MSALEAAWAEYFAALTRPLQAVEARQKAAELRAKLAKVTK